MKLAVIAYDLNSLKAHEALSKRFSEIEYFLVERDRLALSTQIGSVPIWTDMVSIPAETDLKTAAHVEAFSKIKSEFNQFRNEIFGRGQFKLESEVIKAPLATKQIASINEVRDVFFDSKKQKVFIEKTSAGVFEYDFILVEDHQLIAQLIKDRTKNIFQTTPVNSHIWFTIQFQYELKKPREGFLKDRGFFLVKDSANQSLLDNWYFCQFINDRILVQQWVPFNQHQNSDYKKFMIERTRAVVNAKMDSIHLGEYENDYVDTTSGFYQNESSLKNNRLAALIPSFSFWSRAKIEKNLFNLLDAKIKKIIKFKLKLEATRGVS